MSNDKTIADTGKYITVNANNINTSSCVSRACILCGESTGSMHKQLCDDCQKLWMLLKDIAREDGMQ